MNNQLRAFIIIYTISLLWWIATVIYRDYIAKKDINTLRKTYFCAPIKNGCQIYNCNGWCIGHFIQYLLLGYFAPKYSIYAVIIGALFEIVEHIIQQNKFSNFVDAKITEDIFTNTLGTIIGYLFATFKYFK